MCRAVAFDGIGGAEGVFGYGGFAVERDAVRNQGYDQPDGRFAGAQFAFGPSEKHGGQVLHNF